MFTSRAEFRLHLRIDNADERLTPIGRRVGLVSNERWRLFLRKRSQKERVFALLERTRLSRDLFPEVMGDADDRPPLSTWLRRPGAGIAQVGGWIRREIGEEPVHGLLETIETELKYSGYIAQQQRQVDRLRDADRRQIPEDFCYRDIPGLSREVQEKLDRVRPDTLGRASAIPGVTPAALSVLDVYLRLGR
jgi:tRNA uridine 5-carboxymethylaminomethyl modification enzyme